MNSHHQWVVHQWVVHHLLAVEVWVRLLDYRQVDHHSAAVLAVHLQWVVHQWAVVAVHLQWVVHQWAALQVECLALVEL
jgi:hypothetical protein